MKACIYARTSRHEKRHTTTKIENQEALGRELARRLNLTIEPEHVFTDMELTGDLPPTCWAAEGAPSRPALGALIDAIESDHVRRILVRHLDALGTTSEVLVALRNLLVQHDARIVAPHAADQADPTFVFARSVLSPCVDFVDDDEHERRERARARKLEELKRLREKVKRLEAEIDET